MLGNDAEWVMGMRRWRRAALLLLGVISFVAVALAVWLADFLHLSACPLCIFQRVLFLLVGSLALLGAVLPEKAGRGFSFLAGAVGLGGVATAAWQSWLQWFPDPALECNYADPNLIERLVDWLGMRWPDLFMATGFCSSKEWVLLGLSLANWSALLFLTVAVAAFVLAGAGRRRAWS